MRIEHFVYIFCLFAITMLCALIGFVVSDQYKLAAFETACRAKGGTPLVALYGVKVCARLETLP